jgi:glycosyltransferase involved in cell wall biosynthesis
MSIRMSKTLSAIIPTYNKKDYLEITLTSFSIQDWDMEQFQVLVVNDGATDETFEWLEKNKSRFPYQLIAIHQENLGRSSARNSGIRAAEGDIILFVDDDRVCSPQLIREHLRFHDSANTIVAGYRKSICNTEPKSAYDAYLLQYLKTRAGDDADYQFKKLTASDITTTGEEVRHLAYGRDMIVDTLMHLFGANLESSYIPWRSFVTSNVSVSRQVLLDCGLFDDRFTGWGMEDTELGYRLYKAGCHFKLSVDAVNYHLPHSRNQRAEMLSGTKNFRLLCEIHPEIPMFLNWRPKYDGLSVKTLNDIVKATTPTSRTNNEYAALVSDYQRMLQFFTAQIAFDPDKRLSARTAIDRAWECFGTARYHDAIRHAEQFIDTYADRACEYHALIAEPIRPDTYWSYDILNGVVEALLICARSQATLGEHRNAREHYLRLLRDFPNGLEFRIGEGLQAIREIAVRELEALDKENQH